MATILVEAGVVTDAQVAAALERQRETGLRVGETLVELGAATEEDIGWALSRQLGLPFVDVTADALDQDLLESFPIGLLHRLEAVPLIRSESGVSVALTDPTDQVAVAQLELAAGSPISVSIATQSAIRGVLDKLLATVPHPTPLASRTPGAVKRVTRKSSGTNALKHHLSEAYRAGACEIHFVREAKQLRVFHRIGRDLVLAASEPDSKFQALLASIGEMGGPALTPRGSVHRTGWIECPTGTHDAPIEVSVIAHGDNVALTLWLATGARGPLALDDLGLGPVETAQVRGTLDQPAGLVVVCGPRRSGRSAALAGLLQETPTDRRRVFIFGAGLHRIAAAGLWTRFTEEAAIAAWREIVAAQSADVVAIDDLPGERIRDLASSACSGRLVLASTDWTDSFALLEYLTTSGHERCAVASRLQAVIQLRRVRGTGGEHTLSEVVLVTDALRVALRAGTPVAVLQEIAEADGFRPLRESVRAAIASELITGDEAARALA